MVLISSNRPLFNVLFIRRVSGLRQYTFQHPKISDSNIGVTHYNNCLCNVKEVAKLLNVKVRSGALG